MNSFGTRGGRREIVATGVGLVVGSLVGGSAYAAVKARPLVHSRVWTGQLKGINVGRLKREQHQAEFFRDVAATGARLVRIFVWFYWDEAHKVFILPTYAVPALQDLLRSAEAYGLKVVLVGDFETAPNPTLWGNPDRAKGFASAWQWLARWLKDAECMAGYDLLNEPNPPGGAGAVRDEWRALARNTIQAIRSEDERVTIIFEGIFGGAPAGLREMVPFSDENVVYSIHFYAPHAITHQQVYSVWPKALPYPVYDDALLRGTDAYPGPWNAVRLRTMMQDAIDFQQRFRVPIFVGEFSCVRWAPGDSALRYISDAVALFNEFGWSWCYHEFRGFPGWDAEVVAIDRTSQSRSADAPTMSFLRREFMKAR